MIYVFADQLRYLSCGYADDRRAHTPNIDRLAAGGVDFHNCVSMTPVCAAYRASLLTGRYTTTTGMVINELRPSPEHECFGHVLNRGRGSVSVFGGRKSLMVMRSVTALSCSSAMSYRTGRVGLVV